MSGVWTQHVDPATGRTYYFNMRLQRSQWTHPSLAPAEVGVEVGAAAATGGGSAATGASASASSVSSEAVSKVVAAIKARAPAKIVVKAGGGAAGRPIGFRVEDEAVEVPHGLVK